MLHLPDALQCILLKIKPPAFLDRCREWNYEDCKVLRIRAALPGCRQFPPVELLLRSVKEEATAKVTFLGCAGGLFTEWFMGRKADWVEARVRRLLCQRLAAAKSRKEDHRGTLDKEKTKRASPAKE